MRYSLHRYVGILVLLVTMLPGTQTSQAAVIAYDPFLSGAVGADPATNHVFNDPSNGIYGDPNGNFNNTNIGFNNVAVSGGPIVGFGSDDWSTNTGFFRSDIDDGLTHPGLNQQDYSPAIDGGIHHSGSSTQTFIRDLKRDIDPFAASETYYMSGLFNVPTTALNAGEVLSGWIGDQNFDSEMNAIDSKMTEFQGVFFGVKGNGSSFDLITRNRTTSGSTPVDNVLATNITEGETQLMVLKVEVNVNGALDQITAWINPAQSQLDPGGFAASYQADIFDSADQLSQLWITSETPLPGTTRFDEPRLATTYAEAVGLTPFVLTGNEWLGPGGGDWNVSGNWSDSVVPNGAAAEAVLGGNVTGASTVNLNTSITASKISIDSINNYTISGPNTLTLAGDAELAVLGGTHAISAVVAGSAGLNKTGGGTLTLSGANTYTGGTSLAAGTTNFEQDSNLGNSSGGIGLDGGSLRYTGSGTTISRSLTQGASSTLDASGTGAITYNAASISQTGSGPRTLTLAGSNTGDNTLQTTVGDNGGDVTNVTKTGAGTWVLAGNNNYSGPTLILDGTVKIANANALGNTTGGTTIGSNGRLAVSGGITTGEAIGFGGRGSVDSPQLVNSSGNNSLSGELALNGGGEFHVIQSDSGKLTLNGNLTNNTSSATTLTLAGAGDGELSGTFTEQNGSVTSLLKTGTGTWTISTGTNLTQEFYQGTTTIAEGTLAVTDPIANNQGELSSNNVIVESGATFDVTAFDQYSLQVDQSLTGSGTVAANTLRAFDDTTISPGNDSGGAIGALSIDGNLNIENIFAAPTGAINYDLGESTSEGDRIDISGNLALTTTEGDVVLKINPTGTSLANGSYRIVDYGGSLTGSASDFTVDNPTRYNIAVNTATNGQINLDVSGASASINWTGTPGTDWDINNTQAWDNGGSDVFFDLDSVTFNDTATTFAVNLTESVRPNAIIFDHSANDYTVSGSGAISGPTGIVKDGTGSATISTANEYTGATQINAGTLVAGNNNALGSTDAGTVVANGASLDISGVDIGAEPVTAQGTGNGGLGAITSSASNLGVGARGLSSLTLTGDTTVGAHGEEARWDVRAEDGEPALLVGNGHSLTKVGTGTVNFSNANDGTLVGDFDEDLATNGADFLAWQRGESPNPLSPADLADWQANYGDSANTGLGDIVVNTGRLGFLNGTGLGNSANSATVNAGGALAVSGTVQISKPIVLNGGTLSDDGFGENQAYASVSLTANSTVEATAGVNEDTGLLDSAVGAVTFSNSVTGAGGLTKVGTGSLVLPASNTYSGSTVVEEGTVSLGAAGSVASPTIDIRSGATLDVSEQSGFSAASGQTIMGGGEVKGDLSLASGSTIAPDAAGGQLVQTLGATQDVLIRWSPASLNDNPESATGTTLFVGPINLTGQTRSFMDFDVSGLVGQVNSVSLEVFRNGSDGSSVDEDVQVEVHRVTKSWIAGETDSTAYQGAQNGVPVGPPTEMEWDNQGGDFEATVLSELTANANTFGVDTSDSLLWENTAQFLSALTSAKDDDGTLRLVLKVEDAEEDADRNLFRLRSSDNADRTPVLTIVATVAGSTLTVDGDFSMASGSTLAIDIGGDGLAGIDYDVLDITGNAAIAGGTLDVNLVSGFTPSLGDEFDILNFMSSTGAGFDTFSLDPLGGGLDWDTSNLLTTGILSVITAGSLVGANVPEPGSCLLLIMGMASTGMAYRSRR